MDASARLSHEHVFVPGAPGSATLLLLHGTGGDEHDLVPLGRAVAPGMGLLSPRGQVLEGPHARWFRRFPGGFDQEDIGRRVAALVSFLGEAATAYGLAKRPLVGLGHSNGANMAADVLLLAPGALSGAVLFRPMVTLAPSVLPALEDAPVLVLAGRRDELVPPEQSRALVETLEAAGAAVTVRWSDAGHAPAADEPAVVARFVADHFGVGA